MHKNNWFLQKLDKAFLTPIRALRKRYIPLLLVYFAYGLSGFSAIALSFWQKEQLGLSAEQLIMISVWVMVPWTLKMVFGQMVDSVKIFGSRRKIYIFLGAICIALGAVILAGLAGRHDFVMWMGDEYTIYLLSAICTTFGFVIQDVTADTMTTEVVERHEIKNGKRVVRTEKDIQADLSMVQVLGRLALSLAGFSVAGLGGYLAAHVSYETIFWMTLALPLISCAGAFFIRLDRIEEKTVKPLNIKIIGGGIAFAVFSIVMATVDHPYAQEIVFLVSLVLLSLMLFFVTRGIPSTKLKVLVFTLVALFLYRATPSTGPGLTWWAIDELGFDQQFYGVLAQIGAGVALGVLWFCADFIANRPIRSVLIFLVIVEGLMSLPELGMYYGVHEMLGVSARTVALFDTALGSPLVHVSMVPMLALIAYYAPKGNRATWFAVGASFMNLALTGGELLTKYLNKIFIITREVTDSIGEVIVPQNYDELGVLMLWRLGIAVIMPLVAIFLFLKRTPKLASEEVTEDVSEEAPVPGRKKMEL